MLQDVKAQQLLHFQITRVLKVLKTINFRSDSTYGTVRKYNQNDLCTMLYSSCYLQ